MANAAQGPAIETERLILREVEARDFDAWARCFADAEVNRYLLGAPMTRMEAWRNMATVVGHWRLRGFGFFSLEEKLTGDWIGRVGPWFPEGWPAPEVGWTIAPWAQRKGYAAEAGAASIAYAFETLGWDDVIHIILDGNAASVATAEKLGSERRGAIDDLMGLGLVHIYGQSRADWARRQS